MASVRCSPRKDGTTAFIVCFRMGGKQPTLTFDDAASAEVLKVAINVYGPERALAMHGIELAPPAPEPLITVAAWVRHYIDHLTGLEQSTRDRYDAYLANDITPVLGDLPVSLLAEEDISGWVRHLETTGGRKGTGNAPKTLRNKYGFLSAALSAAVGRHCDTNVAAGRRLPRGGEEDGEGHEMRMLTPDDWAVLYGSFTEYWRPLVELKLATGMRWGEISALAPRHVDVNEGTIKIRRAWKYSTKGYHLGPPKTARSRRTIDVAPRLLKALDLDGEYVFTNRDGGPVRYAGFKQRVWDPAVAKSKLAPGPTPHDLRHTYASWQLSAGTPITIVSRQLGHESIQITVDLYGDVDRTSSRVAADVMDRILIGAGA